MGSRTEEAQGGNGAKPDDTVQRKETSSMAHSRAPHRGSIEEDREDGGLNKATDDSRVKSPHSAHTPVDGTKTVQCTC